jgi:hypothetical protein
VLAFAQGHGFSINEIAVQPTTVSDFFANPYQNNRPDPAQRFVVKRRPPAARIRGIWSSRALALSENYPQAPRYFFTRLNDIRSPMLAEATRSTSRGRTVRG